jgi:restriction system protein
MNSFDAVERVLFEAGKPLTSEEITAEVLTKAYWRTTGKTPTATINARLAVDIKSKGAKSKFQRTDPNLFALRAWGLPEYVKAPKSGKSRPSLVIELGLASEIDQHNKKILQELKARLHSIAPAEFETLIGNLLIALGFEEVEVTGYSNDGGIDVRGTLVVGEVIKTRMAVQVKRWQKNVQAPIVQQVRGSLGTHDQGLIITTSDFSTGARDEAERANAIPVALMNGVQLVKLLAEHNIGIRRAKYDLLQLDEYESHGEPIV